MKHELLITETKRGKYKPCYKWTEFTP